MIGLIIITVALAYLLISIWVVKRASAAAKRRGLAGWKWGLPVTLVMYLLVFWDHIPTVVAHKYYCTRYAGFTVYKTLDEWSKENPDIAEWLSSDESFPTEVVGNRTRYDLNQRFIWDAIRENILLSVKRSYNEIIDKQNGEIIARYIDFSAGYGNLLVNAEEGLRAYKFWLTNDSCEKSDDKQGQVAFYKFQASMEQLK